VEVSFEILPMNTTINCLNIIHIQTRMSAIVEADTEIGAVKDIRTVKLISNDGEEFIVAAEIVKLSKMVATGIEGMKLPVLI
jgi:hypothetical protein